MSDDIKSELERKREKLRLLREEKLRRAAHVSAHSQSLAPESIHSSTVRSIGDIDEVLRSLGIEHPPPSSNKHSSTTATNDRLSNHDTTNNNNNNNNNIHSTLESVQELTSARSRKLKPSFGVLKLDIPPVQEAVCYDKETQTLSDHETTDGLQWDDDELFRDFHKLTFGMPQTMPLGQPRCVSDSHAIATVDDLLDDGSGQAPRSLDPNECEQLLQSKSFSDFLTTAGRVMERMLADDEEDDFIDYRTCLSEETELVDKDNDALTGNRLVRPVHIVKQSDTQNGCNAAVTSVDWCMQRPELLLVAYDTQDNEPSKVLIWNQRHSGVLSPEFSLECPHSPIACAMFSPFQPFLVFAGTYGGQIVVWDVRTGKRTPVQRSLPSGTTHLHPVYTMKLVGSENAHSLVSVSTDGKMCTWRPDMIVQPVQEPLSLHYRHSMGVAATSLDFPPGEVNRFVVGSEEHIVYTGLRHGSQKTGITGALEGHHGQVTAVSCHPQMDWADLVLSSSLDWTVRLWSLRDASLIHSFDNSSDYMFDVQWSPSNAALFANVDSGGRVAAWDLASSVESPTSIVQLDSSANRLSWQPLGSQLLAGGKQHLAVGTDQGSVYLLAVSDQLSQPSKSDTSSRLQSVLRDLRKYNQQHSAGSPINS